MEDRSIRVFATRIVCALALVMLGFTGHGLAATDNGPLGAQYLLPDGSYASLCQAGGDTAPQPFASHHCDLCFAASGHAFVPLQPAVLALSMSDGGAVVLLPAPATGLKRNPLRHGLGRGPPVAG